jgi:TIR domain
LASPETPRWAQTLWRTGIGVEKQSNDEIAGQFSWAVPIQPAPVEANLNPARKLRTFLCHAKEDKAKILDLYHELKGCNLEPWLDVYNIIPGQRWEEEIEKSIRSTDAFLVYLSDTSVSKTGYVQAEIKRALDI